MTPSPQGSDPETTESGRPRVARPMPDHSSATTCPHCGEETGMGHYVCWNCSNDIRLPAQSEGEIVEEYRSMLAREEVNMERRNRRFFLSIIAGLVLLAAGNLALGWNPGTSVLFVLIALFPLWWAVKATRRITRIEKAQAE